MMTMIDAIASDQIEQRATVLQSKIQKPGRFEIA